MMAPSEARGATMIFDLNYIETYVRRLAKMRRPILFADHAPGHQEEAHGSHCVSDTGGSGLSAASSTAARHSRFMGKMGGMGATSGSAVGAATDAIFSVIEALRMKRL